MCRPRGLGGSPRAHSRRLDPPSGYLSWLPKPPLVSLATVERRASTMLLLPNHWGPQRQGGLDNSWEAGCQARFSLLPEKWNYTSLWSPFIFFLWFFFFFLPVESTRRARQENEGLYLPMRKVKEEEQPCSQWSIFLPPPPPPSYLGGVRRKPPKYQRVLVLASV